MSCQPSGDSSLVSAPATPTSQTETQAIDNLLQLYSHALRHEDIDRLQSLFQSEVAAASATFQETPPRQAPDDTFSNPSAFGQTLADTFRHQTLTHHAILPDTVQMPDDHTQVAFVEVESVVDPVFRFHYSRVYQTTLRLERTARAESMHFRLAGVQRQGPLVDMATPGQVQAGGRSRVIVSASKSRFAQGRADIVDPATGERRALRATAAGFEGAFTASEGVSGLSVALRDQSGEWLEVSHPYVARRPFSASLRITSAACGSGRWVAAFAAWRCVAVRSSRPCT